MNQISHYQGEEVQDAMAVVAKWMGKKYNLRVNYHGGTAVSADIFNGVINIPRLACSSGLTNEDLSLLRGRVYHEAGHISETELEKKDYPKGVLFEILNAIEDPRMERVIGNNYPGAKMVFTENAHYYNKKIARDVAEGKVNAPLWEALVAMGLQSNAIPPAWRLSEKAQAYFDAGYDTFTEWKTLKDAKGSLELAKKLFDILKQAHEEYKKQQQQEQGESQEQEQGESQEQSQSEQGEGEAQESTGSPTDFDNEEDEQQQSGSNKSEAGEESDEEGDEQSQSSASENSDDDGDSEASGSESDDEADENASESQSPSESQESNKDGDDYDTNYDVQDGQGENATADEQDDADIEAEMEAESQGKGLEEYQDEDIEKAFEELDPADAEYLSRRDLDEHNIIKGNDNDKLRFKQDRQEVAVAVASMVRALEQAMRARTRCRKLAFERRGKVDMKRLPQIAKSLSKDVFYRTRKGEKLETAVEIIIDESGSMSGREMIDVRRVAIAVGEALNQLHIPFEITGSTTKYGGGDYRMPPMDGLNRVNPIVYDHFKTFEQNWVSVCHNMSKTRAHMHNVDGEVVEYAARRLKARREVRKIVLVLSDGLPDAGHGNGSVMGRNIIRTCERARKAGIEVYGFGIGTTQPKQYYGKDNFIYLPNGEDLGPKFATEVSRIISGGRFGK